MKKIISNSEQDTINFARKLATYLKKGDILVLTGELGSGKTKFTQGILTYFGLEKEIASPTFTIVNEYQKEETTIYHFDVYRLSSSDEFYAIGGEQYFENGICIIEWGEIIQDILPPEYIQISFQRDLDTENQRTLTIQTRGERLTNLIEEID